MQALRGSSILMLNPYYERDLTSKTLALKQHLEDRHILLSSHKSCKHLSMLSNTTPATNKLIDFVKLSTWWLPQTSGTHIRESRRFESMYTLQEKTRSHATRFPRSICVWPRPYISRSPCRQLFSSPHKGKTGPYTQGKSWRPKADWPDRCLGSPHSPSLKIALEQGIEVSTKWLYSYISLLST
jgi:hypothetical protein